MRLKQILFIFPLILLGCAGNPESTITKNNETKEKLRVEKIDCNYLPADAENVECPEGHRDSIIPIIYGYPSEEMFDKSDSGLISLGGCEVTDCDPNWWCKIHEIGF